MQISSSISQSKKVKWKRLEYGMVRIRRHVEPSLLVDTMAQRDGVCVDGWDGLTAGPSPLGSPRRRRPSLVPAHWHGHSFREGLYVDNPPIVSVPLDGRADELIMARSCVMPVAGQSWIDS